MTYLHIGHEFQLGLFIIFLIPLIYKHFKKTNFRYFIISFVLISSFIGGSLELVGLISANNLGIIREGLILIFYITTIRSLGNSNKIKFYNILYLIGFIFITILSAIINETSIIQTLLFLRSLIFPFIFFQALLNCEISIKYHNIFIKLIFNLFIVQIFANIWKFIITGEYEKVVGTMSIGEGSLTTIVALIGISMSLLYYFRFKKKKYLLIIMGFLFFAFVGRKRAIAVFAPTIIILASIVYNKMYLNKVVNIKRYSNILIVAFILFYLSLRSFSFLNPERKIWGSFSPSYAYNTASTYLGLEEQNEDYYSGRFGGYLALKEEILKKRGLLKLLVGSGPGKLITSRFIKKKSVKAVYVSRDEFNIDVGSRMGFTWIALQTGIFGVILLLLIYGRIFKDLYRINKKSYLSTKDRLLLIGLRVYSFIFIFDFFLYSSTVIRMETITYSFVYVSAYFLKIRNNSDIIHNNRS